MMHLMVKCRSSVLQELSQDTVRVGAQRLVVLQAVNGLEHLGECGGSIRAFHLW